MESAASKVHHKCNVEMRVSMETSQQSCLHARENMHRWSTLDELHIGRVHTRSHSKQQGGKMRNTTPHAAHASSPRDTKNVRGLARSRHSEGDRDKEHSTAKKQLAEAVRQTTGGQENAIICRWLAAAAGRRGSESGGAAVGGGNDGGLWARGAEAHRGGCQQDPRAHGRTASGRYLALKESTHTNGNQVYVASVLTILTIKSRLPFSKQAFCMVFQRSEPAARCDGSKPPPR